MAEISHAKQPSGTLNLALIYTLIILYAICYQLQRPIEPFLVDRLINHSEGGEKDTSTSDSQQTYGNLQTLFNICQMIGSLIFGTIIDKYGVRVGFLVNFMACASSYYLLSQATTINYLYYSKIPGMFMAGFLVGQSACLKEIQSSSKGKGKETDQNGNSSISESNRRINVLGKLTACYTAGATVGPTLGGLLGAHGDYYFGAKLACIGSLLSALLAWFGLANIEGDATEQNIPHKDDNGKNLEEKKKKVHPNDWSFLGRYYQAFQISGVFLSIKAVTSVANSMASTVQPLILKNQLGFSERGLGLFMSFTYCVGGLVNGFGLETISKILGKDTNGSPKHVNGNGEIHLREGNPRLVVKNSILGMSLLYAFLSFIYSTVGLTSLEMLVNFTGQPFFKQIPYIIITLILSILQFTLGTSITAETTSLVPKEIRGTMISLEHSFFSAPRIVAPSIGVAIFGIGDISGLCFSCALIFLSVLFCWNRYASTSYTSSH